MSTFAGGPEFSVPPTWVCGNVRVRHTKPAKLVLRDERRSTLHGGLKRIALAFQPPTVTSSRIPITQVSPPREQKRGTNGINGGNLTLNTAPPSVLGSSTPAPPPRRLCHSLAEGAEVPAPRLRQRQEGRLGRLNHPRRCPPERKQTKNTKPTTETEIYSLRLLSMPPRTPLRNPDQTGRPATWGNFPSIEHANACVGFSGYRPGHAPTNIIKTQIPHIPPPRKPPHRFPALGKASGASSEPRSRSCSGRPRFVFLFLYFSGRIRFHRFL